MNRRFRAQHRRSRSTTLGQHSWSFGLRVGYWPCLKAPFIVLEVATHRFDIWHGLPGYES